MTASRPIIAPASDRSGRTYRPAVVLVWLISAATLATILGFIARDGRNIPFEEDWLMVAPMTGHESDLPHWLWSQNSEHRLPLPRLVNLALLRVTGDFRSTMVFDTLALGLVAGAMILLARWLRGGRTSAADAFFSLLLLHLGNWDNLVWAWQIQFVLPTVLASVLLLIIVARPPLDTFGASVGGALVLVCLPLSGANGLVLTPALAGWFAYVAWTRKGDPVPDGRIGAGVPAAAALLALLLCGAYFAGYEASPWNAPSPGPRATLATTGKFLAFSLGPIAERAWLPFGVVAGLIFAASLGALAATWRERPDERLRVAGLLAFLAAIAMLTLAVGWGRAGRAAETGRMPTRYVLLAAPGMCAAYYALLLYGKGILRRIGPGALALLVAILFPLNTHVGLKRRAWFGAGMTAFEHDLAAGATARELAARHHEFMLHWDEALMVTSMEQLRDARIGPFVRLPAP